MAEITKLLEQLKVEAGLGENLVHWKHIPANPPRFGDWPFNLHPKIIDAVKEHATVGEISDIFREVFGQYRDPAYV